MTYVYKFSLWNELYKTISMLVYLVIIIDIIDYMWLSPHYYQYEMNFNQNKETKTNMIKRYKNDNTKM